jgi:hypothetical protein
VIRRRRRAASKRRRYRALEPVLEPRFVRSLSRLASSDEDANNLTCDVAAFGRAGRRFVAQSSRIWIPRSIGCRNCLVARTTSSNCSVPLGHRRAQIVRKRAPYCAVCPVCRCALIRSKPCISTISRRYADVLWAEPHLLERARDGFASSTQSLSWAVHGNAPLFTTTSLQADDLSIEFLNYVKYRIPIYISAQKANHQSLD